jgi:hypothetical protein
MNTATIKIVKEIYRNMQRNMIEQHDNGARMTGERGTVDLVTPKGTPSVRELCGYVRASDGSIIFDDVEMDEAPVNAKALAMMGRTNPTALFIDGSDALFAGHDFVYSVPLRLPLVRQHGKGHNIMLEAETARIIGLMAQLAEAQLTVASGTMDGENLLIDITAMTREDGTFKLRIETPILFGPWADFTELIKTLMGGADLVVQPRVRSLKSALNKVVAEVTPSRGDRSRAFAELILKDGEMAVRPLVPTTSDDDTLPAFHTEALPVKIDGCAGSSDANYQFFPAQLMHTAMEMFDVSGVATMALGSRIGEPIVLWNDNARFAIRTAGRV